MGALHAKTHAAVIRTNRDRVSRLRTASLLCRHRFSLVVLLWSGFDFFGMSHEIYLAQTYPARESKRRRLQLAVGMSSAIRVLATALPCGKYQGNGAASTGTWFARPSQFQRAWVVRRRVLASSRVFRAALSVGPAQTVERASRRTQITSLLSSSENTFVSIGDFDKPVKAGSGHIRGLRPLAAKERPILRGRIPGPVEPRSEHSIGTGVVNEQQRTNRTEDLRDAPARGDQHSAVSHRRRH